MYSSKPQLLGILHQPTCSSLLRDSVMPAGLPILDLHFRQLHIRHSPTAAIPAAMPADASHSSPALRDAGTLARAVALLLLTFKLVVQPSAALPQLYVARIARTDCSSHPRQAYGQHKDPIADR